MNRFRLWRGLLIAGFSVVPVAAVTSSPRETLRPDELTIILLDPLRPNGALVPQPLEQPKATFDVLPNWDGGRTADQLLPNYEPGRAEFLLIDRPPADSPPSRRFSELPMVLPTASSADAQLIRPSHQRRVLSSEVFKTRLGK
jgi:hypothetical protein